MKIKKAANILLKVAVPVLILLIVGLVILGGVFVGVGAWMIADPQGYMETTGLTGSTVEHVQAMGAESLAGGIAAIVLGAIYPTIGLIFTNIAKKKLAVATKKADLIPWGILNIVFGFAPAGVLLLCVPTSALTEVNV